MLAPLVWVEGGALSVDQIHVPQHTPAMLKGVVVHSLPLPVSHQDIVESVPGEVSRHGTTMVLFHDLLSQMLWDNYPSLIPLLRVNIVQDVVH